MINEDVPLKSKSSSVAEYIAKSAPESRKPLRALRALVRAAAPRATEKISYGIPTFVLNGKNLVYIAGWTNHVSVYPVTAGVKRGLKAAIKPYHKGRGTLQFPLANPLPKTLIKRIVKVRVGEVMARDQ